jgi:hypothetical protein
MVARLGTMNWWSCWWKWPWPNFADYADICLKALKRNGEPHVFLQRFVKTVYSLDYPFGRCPLSEAYLIYVTFREVAVPPPWGSHFLVGWKKRSVSASDITTEPEDGVNHFQKAVSMKHTLDTGQCPKTASIMLVSRGWYWLHLILCIPLCFYFKQRTTLILDFCTASINVS